MTKNEELTELLHGSMITVIAQQEEGKLELGFDDGTWITANTEPGTVIDSNTLAGGVVETVNQGEGELSLKLESGESVGINTAEPSASVIVANGAGI